MARMPNTTVKFPEKVKALLRRDASNAGHDNVSLVVRQIVFKHYGLIKKVGV